MRRLMIAGLLLAGCGHEAATFVDAGPVDAAGADGSSTTDAPSGTAHVTVHVRGYTGDGADVAGASVLFVDGGGATVAEATTDGTGSAAVAGPSGGSVIVSQPGEQAGTTEKTLVAGVRDGDRLRVGPSALPITEDVASIDFPANPGGATRYSIEGACVSGQAFAPPIDGVLQLGCPTSRTVVVAAEHGTGAPDYLVATDVSLTTDAEVTLTGAWTAPSIATITATGLPGDATTVELTRIALAGGVEVATQSALATVAGDTATAELAGPAGAGGRQLVYSEYRLGDKYTMAYQETAFGPVTIDSGSHVPRVTRASGASTWTLGPGTADGIYALAVEGGTGPQVRWHAVLPPDATGLPPFVQVAGIGIAVIVEDGALAGYDAYRAAAGETLIGAALAYPLPEGTRIELRYF